MCISGNFPPALREGGREVSPLGLCVCMCFFPGSVGAPFVCVCVCVCVCVAGGINITSLADTFLPSRKWMNQMLASLGRKPSELCGLLGDELLVTV